jgi:hypothetical protein
VEPQPRDTGGRFAKRTTEPAAEPAVEPAAEHGDEHGDATVLEYPEAEPRRPRPRTGKKPAQAAKKPAPRARRKPPEDDGEHGDGHGDPRPVADTGRPLGFLDGLGAPLGLTRGRG